MFLGNPDLGVPFGGVETVVTAVVASSKKPKREKDTHPKTVTGSLGTRTCVLGTLS